MPQVLSFPRKALAAATADAVFAAFVLNCISAAFHLFVPLLITQNCLLHLFVSHLLFRRGWKRADLRFEALGRRVHKQAVHLANLVSFHGTEEQNKNTF